MEGINNLQDFLVNETVQLSITDFIIHLILSGFLAFVVGKAYCKFGQGISDRQNFAANFIPIAMTTMAIISIVKSSLALSLGLVGALSIVRFRTAIKEPEELAYLFLVIAIGLGMGAGQVIVTAIACAGILGVIVARGLLLGKEQSYPSMYLSVILEKEGGLPEGITQQLTSIISKASKRAHLKRYEDQPQSIESTFLVEIEAIDDFEALCTSIKKEFPGVKLSFLDNSVSYN